MVSAQVRWSVAAGVAFGLTAAYISMIVGPVIGFTNPFTVAVPISAFLTGSIVWFLVVERRGGDPVAGGLIAGVLTGFLAHIALLILIAIQTEGGFLGLTWMIPFSLTIGALITVPMAIFPGVGLGVFRKHYQ